LGDWEYLTQGGDKMMRLSRVDAVEIQLARYVNLACRKRNAHGELHGVKNDTHL
jgi:hypothetical protein